jgi:hypothetical protein
VVSSTPWPHFTPGKNPVLILQEAGWAPGPVWTGGKSRPHRDSIPDRPTRTSVTITTELPGPQYHRRAGENYNKSDVRRRWTAIKTGRLHNTSLNVNFSIGFARSVMVAAPRRMKLTLDYTNILKFAVYKLLVVPCYILYEYARSFCSN